MAGLGIKFEGKPIATRWRARMERETRSRIARAITGGARDAAKDIQQKGRANIRQSGNFQSSRWTQGLYTEVMPKSGALLNATIHVRHKIWFAGIHEYGGIIRGRPLLWIPLSFATDAQGVNARDYQGGLFRVDRKGGKRPLLLSIRDKKPKYFGIESVRIPRRWRIRDISRQTMRRFNTFYNRHLKRR